MADAWEILYGNSSLITGDAWEHLNAQEGGGGETVIVDGVVSIEAGQAAVELAIIDSVSIAAVEGVPVTITITDSVSIEAEDYQAVDLEVCP